MGSAFVVVGRGFPTCTLGDVDRDVAFAKVPGRVLGSVGGEGGRGGWEPGRGGVGVWVVAGNSEGVQAPSLSVVGDDGGRASFARHDWGVRGEEVVRSSSLVSVPEGVHISECGNVGGEKISPIG